jgi:heme o synthase
MNTAMENVIDTVQLPAEAASPGLVGDVCTLTKARLSTLVLITTLVGFLMAAGPKIEWLVLASAMFATALVAASAAILNQVIEANVDRLMDRTKNRPLPTGRMKISSAVALGVAFAVVGSVWLALAANMLSACLSIATLLIYIFLYTPLKRKTSLCTLVGAVSGAIPPVIGWTAARPSLDAGAWILFGVLFLWQMPHFLSIAWLYRDEYAQAGFVMLRRNDVGGHCTARASLLFTIALTVVTLLPAFAGLVSMPYFFGALACDVLLLACAVQFVLHRNRASARRLFFASICYLPFVLGLLVFAKS